MNSKLLQSCSRHASIRGPLVIGLVASGLGLLVLFTVLGSEIWGVEDPQSTDANLGQKNSIQKNSKKAQFPVTISKPAGSPTVETGLTDAAGNRVEVACATCHATRKPNANNRRPQDLDEFHVDLSLSHGNVSCLSCHNSKDYDSLQLADGSRVEFVNVMTLCAQCHGQQMTDYEHNVHGGMNGYWDLSRGPRSKNNCIDCHDPHSPKFPMMRPTFKPRDRFLTPGGHDSD